MARFMKHSTVKFVFEIVNLRMSFLFQDATMELEHMEQLHHIVKGSVSGKRSEGSQMSKAMSRTSERYTHYINLLFLFLVSHDSYLYTFLIECQILGQSITL